MKVADLLEILNITKQSLGRVLKQLVDEGYVLQKEGAQDRRQRLLYVTPKGEALALKLATLQTQRINRAFGELGPNAHEAARRFLTSMIDTDNREGVLRLIARADRATKPRSRCMTRRIRRHVSPLQCRLRTQGTRQVDAWHMSSLRCLPTMLPDDAPHLLVVDDDRRIRDLLSRFLTGEGYRVTTADTAWMRAQSSMA